MQADMTPDSPPERTKLWRLPQLGNPELLHATYIRQSFARHTHEGYAVGVIERGALGFFYRGENLVAPSGAVNLANPDEPHTGHAAGETGWTYRMFYLDAEILQQATDEIAGRPVAMPFFQAGVIHDDALARLIHQTHHSLEQEDIPGLEKETRLLWMLTQLILRYADAPPALQAIGRERRAVRRVRDYIEAQYHEDLSINRLAAVANLSPFHFIRVFRNETGLPPHAFLVQVRVRKAKALLAQRCPIATAAFETGFVDQSHLTRHFKRIFGVTPGQYSKIVQDC